MRSLTALWQQAKIAAQALAKRIAEATVPTKGSRLRLSPLAAMRPRPRGLTGLELAHVRTQKRSGLSYRAGRSKYAEPELKQAVALARLRAA